MLRTAVRVACLCCLFAAPASAVPAHRAPAESRVGGWLAEALQAWSRGDGPALQRVADHAQALTRGDLPSGRWRVQLHMAPGLQAEDLDAHDLADVGGEVAVLGADLADVWLPLAAVRAWIDRHPEVAFAQLPWRPSATVGPQMSQGAAQLRTPEVVCLGADGTGTTVAVLDEGFDHLGEAVASGEVPKIKGSILDGGGAHGTMCSEVVADTAPGTAILPVRTETMAAMQAFAKLVGQKGNPQGVTLVSHSAIWLGMSFGQHEGKACEVTDTVRSGGVAWVNAAGNSGGGSFYRAAYVDANKDGYHDFEPGEDKLYFYAWHGRIQMTMDWDDYKTRKVNLDLELWFKKDGSWQKVDESVMKTGTFVPPMEQIIYDKPPSGLYALRVRAVGKVKPDMRLRIVSMGYGSGSFSVWHDNGNVYDPASCDGVLTVGAIFHGHYAEGPLESYSSYGPTPDGRQKPEVMAPTGVATTQGAFYGTSAACPHAAGALAAWAGATGQNAEDLVQQMREEALAMGEAHPDTAYGWGRVVLPPVSLGWQCTATDLPDGATCATACGSIGTRQCDKGCRFTDCAAPAEICNGVDDDCDGTTDRGPNGEPLGACPGAVVDAGSDGSTGASQRADAVLGDGPGGDAAAATPIAPTAPDQGCSARAGGPDTGALLRAVLALMAMAAVVLCRTRRGTVV